MINWVGFWLDPDENVATCTYYSPHSPDSGGEKQYSPEVANKVYGFCIENLPKKGWKASPMMVAIGVKFQRVEK